MWGMGGFFGAASSAWAAKCPDRQASTPMSNGSAQRRRTGKFIGSISSHKRLRVALYTNVVGQTPSSSVRLQSFLKTLFLRRAVGRSDRDRNERFGQRSGRQVVKAYGAVEAAGRDALAIRREGEGIGRTL